MTTRIFIYPKDIAQLMGRSEKQARIIYNQIKDSLGKLLHQNLTIDEYANYEGIAPDQIKKHLGK